MVEGLNKQREWFRSKGIYLLLREKLEVICWRNMFVILAGVKNGRQGMRLSLSKSVKVARKIFMDPSIDEDDIVCMASSLIDQGYLKAYVKLGETIVFGSVLPSVSSIGQSNVEGIGRVTALSAPAMSTQNSSDSGVNMKPTFKIRGTGRSKHVKRFA